ncbi:MAG: Clp protease N-terminal domain-containing protein, partial [Myxococcota bacterium]
MTPPTGNMRVRPTFRFPLTPPAIYLVDQTFSAAAERRTAPSSNHLLVAFLARDSPAYAVLRDHDVELPPLTIDYMDMDALEPPEVLQTIWGTADSLAEQGEAYITPLHLLAGLLRYHTGSQAVSLLQRHGYDPSWLRNRLIAYLTTRPNHEPLS